MERNAGYSAIRIFLVRHGETEWNRLGRFQGRNDQCLNEKGKKQVQALAEALKHEHFDAIYVSPLPRALETAECIKKFHPETPLIRDENLVEMELGEFEGIEVRQWMEQNQDFVKAWAANPSSVRIPGGECLEEVQQRAVRTLNTVIHRHTTGSTLLICSHNFVLETLLCYVLGISLDRFREVKKGTASYSILSFEGGKFKVEVVNERKHLERINMGDEHK
jgi:phosphoserine phosphatase